MLRSGQATQFCNHDIVVQSWFAAMPSRRLRVGQARGCRLGARRIVIYRGGDGVARAADGDCPHLGADLSQGTVIGGGLCCAFHHWCFDERGNCHTANGGGARTLRVYPVQERWGLVWIFNGEEPLYSLPAPSASLMATRLPSQSIRCHPHLMIANGLDAVHLQSVHDLNLTAAPVMLVNADYAVGMSLQGRPTSRFMAGITRCTSRDFVATFTAIGGHLAHLRVVEPLPFEVIFTGWPTADGHCQTRTLLFTERRFSPRFFQALACLYMIVAADRRILERVQFSPGFVSSDAPLAEFATMVNRMPTW
jgi:nitrite reductase/ring-hydroxylating ferredoxin subunit